MTAMPAPAISTATGLAFPTSPAITEGNPKMPLPRMLLTASATMLQRPIARTSSGCEVRGGACIIAPCITKPATRTAVPDARSPRAPFVCDAPGVQCQRASYDIAKLHGLSAANKPLLARYDLGA